MMALVVLALSVGPLFSPEDLYGWSGERTRAGWCEVEPVSLPGGGWSLKLTYIVKDGTVVDWLDVTKRPVPPKDLSKFEAVEFEIMALKPGPLHIRIDDPDIPPRADGGRVAYEAPIKGLEGGEWVRVRVPLPKDPRHKDSITTILLYIPTKGTKPGRYEFLVGRFKSFTPPEPRKPKAVKLTLVKGADFSEPPDWLLLREGAKVEKGLLLADTRGRGGVWHEFLHSDRRKLPLEAGKSYIVRFRYRVVAPATGYFYFLARHEGNLELDQGWTVWRGEAGSEGIISVKIGPLPRSGYHLILGIRGEGAICVDDLSVWLLL